MLSENSSVQGFTLIEMLVTVVIIGIFAMMTLPAYQDSLRSGRRGDAKAELMRLAQAEAKWRMSHVTYANATELGGLPATTDYTFAVATNTASNFVISAVPTSTRGQNKDVCGELTINQDSVLVSKLSLCSKP